MTFKKLESSPAAAGTALSCQNSTELDTVRRQMFSSTRDQRQLARSEDQTGRDAQASRVQLVAGGGQERAFATGEACQESELDRMLRQAYTAGANSQRQALCTPGGLGQQHFGHFPPPAYYVPTMPPGPAGYNSNSFFPPPSYSPRGPYGPYGPY